MLLYHILLLPSLYMHLNLPSLPTMLSNNTSTSFTVEDILNALYQAMNWIFGWHLLSLNSPLLPLLPKPPPLPLALRLVDASLGRPRLEFEGPVARTGKDHGLDWTLTSPWSSLLLHNKISKKPSKTA